MRDLHATFQIGLKILLQKDGLILFLRDKQTNHLDFPGGRMNEDEKLHSLPTVIEREVREELGNAILYKLGNPLFQYRRHTLNNDNLVFITIYSAEYISGDIILSKEHSSYEWMDPKKITFQESDFGNAGEFEAMQTYFKKLRSE